jgi:hypothetical protein
VPDSNVTPVTVASYEPSESKKCFDPPESVKSYFNSKTCEPGVRLPVNLSGTVSRSVYRELLDWIVPPHALVVLNHPSNLAPDF